MEFIIRKAIKDDIKFISEFQIIMANETEGIKLDREIVLNGVTQAYKNSQKGQYFVAECENKIIACLMLTFEWSDWRCANFIWVQSVFVLKEYRQKGVFRKMFEHIKNIYENEKDFCGIKLYVDKENINAQQIYLKLGFYQNNYLLFQMKNS